MPFPLIAAGIGAAASLFGAREQRRAQQDAIDAATTQLMGGRTLGPGGAFANFGFNEHGQTISNIGLGELNVPFLQGADVARLAGREGRRFLNFGAPEGVTRASGALDVLGALGEQSFAGRQGITEALGAATASDIFNTRGNILELLRAQARPEEQRQLQNFQSMLRGSGRGAVTGAEGNEASIGGGRLTAAFAEGLGRADLQRQISAQTLEDNLLTSAFGRFAQTQNLASDLFQNRFTLGQERLGRQVRLAGLPAELAGAFQALAGQGTEQAIRLGEFGRGGLNQVLNIESAAANARIGAGSNIANIIGGSNFSASPVADAIGSLAQPFVTQYFQDLIKNRQPAQTSNTFIPDPSGGPLGTFGNIPARL